MSCTNSNAASTSTTGFLSITIVGFHGLIAVTFRRDGVNMRLVIQFPEQPTRQAASFDEVFFRFEVANGSSRWGV